ncbi:MAG TPA: hypothetical protein VHC22_09780 [Pirellulales bacterium]|nr:hypothetical protein [Pirellulales bacterium]
MPILVVCPSCKTSFKVSDQFAGKQGPCPKCKTPIKIPKPEPTPAASAKSDGKTDPKKAAPPPVEVKIHEPDAVGPKTSTGRPVVKPILRKETKVQAVPIVIIAGATLLAFAAAWLLRKPLGQQVGLRAVGLLFLSPPLVFGGYWFLQNDELEPYRGRSLLLRSLLCAGVYAALWGGYLLLPADAAGAAWNWIYLAPPFFLIGAGAAFATLDLEVESAFFHYCFYVLVTLALGFVAHLHMPWQPVKPRPPAPRTSLSAVDLTRKKNRGEIEWTSPRPIVKPFADCDGGVAARRTRIWQC